MIFEIHKNNIKNYMKYSVVPQNMINNIVEFI